MSRALIPGAPCTRRALLAHVGALLLCLSGVRAEMLPYGAPEYLDLELFLARRAEGLRLEAPGVRR